MRLILIRASVIVILPFKLINIKDGDTTGIRVLYCPWIRLLGQLLHAPEAQDLALARVYTVVLDSASTLFIVELGPSEAWKTQGKNLAKVSHDVVVRSAVSVAKTRAEASEGIPLLCIE